MLVGWLVAQRVIHCSSRWNFVPFWGRQQQEKHSKHPQKCHICLELFHLFKMEHVEQLNHYFGFDKHGDALKEAFSYPTHSTKWKNNHHEICFLYRAFSMRRVSPNIIIWPNCLIFHQPKFHWNKRFLSKTLPFGFFGCFLSRLTLVQESEIVKHEILRLDILMNNVTSGHMLQCQQELLRQTGGQQTAKPRVSHGRLRGGGLKTYVQVKYGCYLNPGIVMKINKSFEITINHLGFMIIIETSSTGGLFFLKKKQVPTAVPKDWILVLWRLRTKS